ncbi:MAG: phage holin family protein [Roseburia sp.]|nr:phage holin family protein [Roseburia sp.]MCM1279756.1 phage holin family protein [Robinsoniella sp.]
MSEKIKWIKNIIIICGTWISNKLGLLLPALILLTILMIVDYIAGMLASKKESLQFPNNPQYGWSSKVSIMGIYKKTGYLLTILVAISTDFLIFKFAEEINLTFNQNTVFGLLVTIWLIINELLSILENVGRLGVLLPSFLLILLSELKDNLDNKK